MSDGSAYRTHLQSARWAGIKSDAAARSQGLCELCKNVASETHHIQYPRGYANDSADNVLHVCSACHRRLHGMKKLTTEIALQPFRARTFRDRPFSGAQVDESGLIWASWPSWCVALGVPTELHPRLLALTIARANAREREVGNDEDLMRADPRGEHWFKWAAIDDGLDEWRLSIRSRRDRHNNKIEMSESERHLANNYEACRRWGQKLQQDELVRRVQAPQTGNVIAMSDAQLLERVTRDIGLLGVRNAKQIGEIDRRLFVVEQSVKRDPEEFIDAESFVIEIGRSPRTHVAGTRLLLPNWLGRKCAEAACERGARIETRLEGSSITTHSNKWRRRDLQAMLDKLPQD